jgi:energy-coupling factor transporter transmembrane protein EcfT
MGAVFFIAFVVFIAIIFIVLSIAVIVIWYIRKRRGKNPKKWWRIAPMILLVINLIVVLVPVVYIGSLLHSNSSNQSVSVTIDGVTYRSGFYGDLYPVFGQVGDIGSDTLEEEILFDDGNRKFRRVDFEGHDWVHSYTGQYSGGTVYCAESQWEQMSDYYTDPLNFEYYYGVGYYMVETSTSIPDIDPQKFDELMAFSRENEYQPFNSSSNKKVSQKTRRIPEDEFHQGVCFYRVSNDGYFTTVKSPMYFEHDDKLLLVFYHDGGRDNGGIKEVVAVEAPDELGQYFLGLMDMRR